MKWRSSINYKNRILLNLECTKFLLDIILNKIILIVLSRLQLFHLQLIQYFYFTDKIIRYVIWNNQYLNKKKNKTKVNSSTKGYARRKDWKAANVCIGVKRKVVQEMRIFMKSAKDVKLRLPLCFSYFISSTLPTAMILSALCFFGLVSRAKSSPCGKLTRKRSCEIFLKPRLATVN